MKISHNVNTSKVPTSNIVPKIGKYMYKNLDGALTQKSMSNAYEVRLIVLYEIPRLQRRIGYSEDWVTHEMIINLNITTYQNKIRVNLIEESPEEQTVGYDLYEPELFQNLESATDKIYSRICKRLTKRFSEYDFLF